MKFIHYLEKISGIGVYGLSSLIIFGLFFLVMLIWALRADKNMMEELRNLPLDKLKGGKMPLLLTGLLLAGMGARAEGPAVPPSTNNPFVVIMIILIIILALAIALLANVLLGAAQIPVAGPGKAAADAHDGAGTKDRPASAAGFTLLSVTAVTGLSDTAFYMICGVIILEMMVLLTLLYNVRLILSVHKKVAVAAPDAKADAQAAAIPAVPRITWWERINRLKPAAEEVSLDLGHDYDGIRELDNRLPPWWLYGFYGTILFACIYLWRYHVVHSAPLPEEEYTISVQKAELQKAAYLKNVANLVDENTVKQLTGAADLVAGQHVFEATCFACHGKAGEGGVGPNLTDEYWLHGGSIQELFKSVKYGWPEKGMKSWKDDYSPSQIAQIASYVSSLKGTHPANAKAPQGTIPK